MGEEIEGTQVGQGGILAEELPWFGFHEDEPLYKMVVHLPGPPDEDEWACNKLQELGVDPDKDIHQGEKPYLEFHNMPGDIVDNVEFHLVYAGDEYPVRIDVELMPRPGVENNQDYVAGFDAAMRQVEERLAGAFRQAEEKSRYASMNQGIAAQVACSSTIKTMQDAFAAATDTVGQPENISRRMEDAFRRLDVAKEQPKTRSQAPAPGC
jgi:hypothetical protein